MTLINGYGLSEAMTLAVTPRRRSSARALAVDRAAVPRPAPVLLLDDEGTRSPPGEVGEIVVARLAGPRRSCSATTRTRRRPPRAIRDGWLHTGDNAYADEQGYLYFFDRKKDMIKRAGENVVGDRGRVGAARAPRVAEAAVVGVPDPIRDEAVAAVVVRRPGAS